MQCTQCKGQLQPNDLTCSFCGAATPLAQQQADEARRKATEAEARAQEQQREREAARAADLSRAERQAAQQALMVSAFGLLCCFFLPIPAAIGAVLAMRARSAAQAGGRVPPGMATVALVLSGLNVLTFIAVLVGVVIANQHVAEERAALQLRLEGKTTEATLTQGVACDLTKLHLLEHGFEKANPTAIDHFQCDGRLTQEGDRALLEDVRFTHSTEKGPTHQRACLRKGERWHVDELVAPGVACP